MSKVKSKRKGKFLHKFGASIVAILLVIAMVLGYSPTNSMVLAAEYLSDLSTVSKYTESLGDNASTEYAGRIWTDKTVFAGDAVFTGYSGSQQTVEKGDEDFLVAFSALATSQSISGQTQAPIDVVFIIDLSGSMSNEDSDMKNSAGQTYSRIKFTVDAVNKAITDLMELNPYTRVGVVGFNESGTTLLELDRYTKSGNNAFFSLSRNTGSKSNATLYTKAVNGSGQTITKETDVKGGTNIQHGLYQGMSLLANAGSTTVTINGQEVKRVPSVVLLSDGAPTYSSSNPSWWAPVVTNQYPVQGPGSSSYYGNGMLAIMTGAYMKAQIDEHYKVAGTNQATTVYTIGMGINDLVEKNWLGQITSTADRDLARVTLNPKVYLDTTHEDYDEKNTFAEAIQEAWDTYCGKSNNTPAISVNNYGVTYTLTHPTTNDISGDALKNYVDLQYDADDADSIAEVFQNIVNNIAISTPEIPTEHDPANPMSSGYITYTDPIGEYMEVKDMKAIIYAGEKYLYVDEQHGIKGKTETKENADGTTTTTYIFQQKAAGNDVYGSEELAHILINVTTSEAANGIKKQVLTVEIPASLIPIRVNTVQLNADGVVTSHTNNGTYPIRVLYTVGLQDSVLSDGNVLVEKLSDEYIAKNSNTDGTIDFYSNLYTGKNIVNGRTAGDATVVFDAASTNPFYYMQEDGVIYEDLACTREAKTIQRGETYYYKEVYYHGTQVVPKTTERTGAQLLDNTTVVQHDDGYWYRPAGTVRVNNMLVFEGTKTRNATGTAADFYAPTFNGETGEFTVYLGNNGVMSVEATGSLEIAKTVTADEGLTAPDANFTFTVDLEGATGKYPYVIVDAEGNGVGEGTIEDGGTIVLKAGQKATIVNLPPKATYTVTEAEVDGFTTYIGEEQKNSATGTITAGAVTSTTFKNHYKVEELTFPTSGTLEGKKVLEGRNWAEDDAFTFFISATNNAPLPTDYDAEAGVTVEYKDVQNNEATFDFGTIKYTKPGLYRYTIMEKEPENDEYLPGMTYSRALYSVVVYVVDNGNGTLSYTSNVQRLYTDDATPLFTYDDNEQLVLNPGEEGQDAIVFTNTYNADSVVRVPVALKSYTDNSGQKPLQADMFHFTLTPLGVVDITTNTVKPGTASENPMPVENGVKLTSVTTTNEGENITFLPVTFTHDDIPDGQNSITYRYTMEETGFDKANAKDNGDGTYTLNGMTYDGKVYVIDVTVSIDPEKAEVIVNAVYPDDKRIVTFENVYDPADTSVELKGKKVLAGRKLLESDTFTFELKDANGTVLQTETVTGVKDVNEVAFTFDNAIQYDKPGTYTYTITEKVPADGAKIAGITYDETVWTVRVDVKDNNGVLGATVYYNNVVDADENAGAVFNNTYKATFDTNTAIDLDGTKKLTGRPLTAGGFYFSVEALNGAPMGERAAYVPSGEDLEPDENGVYEGDITFLEDVVYTEAGEYKYQITEVIPKDNNGNVIDNGVTYDESVYTVTVTVTDNYATGKLTAAVTQILKNDTLVEDIVFENTYEPEDTVYIFRALQKVLSGERKEALKAGEFEFVRTADKTEGIEFYQVDNPATTDVDESKIPVGVNGEDVVANDAKGIVTFGNIKFTKAGTYVVSIREKIPTDATENGDGTYTKEGVTYDTHVVQGTFTVVDNLNGELVATVTHISGSSTFTNIYRTTGTLEGATNLKVTKILDVAERNPDKWTENDQFTFVLESGNAATTQAIADEKVVLPTETSIVIGKPEAGGSTNSKAFDDIVFYAPGTYVFNIREEAGTEIGMDYDATVRTITVIATDIGNGTLQITLGAGSATNPDFTNIYNAEDVVLPGHGNLHVNKEFTGRPNDEWLDSDSFQFTMGINQDDEDTVDAYDEGKITFATNGTTLTITKDNKDVAHFGNITFGREGTYEFIIDEVDGNIAGVTYDSSQWKAIVKVRKDTVKDAQDKDVVVLVIDSVQYVKLNANGEVIEKAEDEEVLTFTNTYSTDNVPLTDLNVTKVISGRNWFDNDSFTFTLAAGNTVTSEALLTNQIVFGGDNEAETMSVEVTQNAQTKQFGEITFHAPGTYTFLVREVVPEDTQKIQGITYDTHTETIVVEVIDNGAGELVIGSQETSNTSIPELTWNNTYTPEPVTTVLTGVKTINGRDLKDSDVFYFNISALNDLARTAMPTNTQVTNATDGTITFGPLTFKTAGTYEYAISERTVNAHGITSDTGYVRATVDVTYSGETGKLTAGEPTYQKVTGGAVVGDDFEFVNNYSTVGLLDGSTHLKVTKHFTGRANNAWLAGDEFTFALEAYDNTIAKVQEGIVTLPDNAAGITISYRDTLKEKAFGSIKFTQPGDYQFLVTEVVTNDNKVAGVRYDEDLQRIIYVKVVDNGNGTLTATVVKEENKQSESLTFNNEYDTTQTTLDGFVVEKQIVGRDWITGDSYSFTLAADVNHALTKAALDAKTLVMPGEEELQVTITNQTENHKAAFGKITFNEAGTYKFVITEDIPTEGKLPSVTYDSRIKHITVLVVDNNDGTLTATATVDNHDNLVFVNTYKAESVAATFAGTKKMLGDRTSLSELDKYNFTIKVAEGSAKNTPLPAQLKVENKANGEITFAPITFREVGTYKYVITEDIPAEGKVPGVTYTTDTVIATVTVTDNNQTGKLEATVSYEGLEDENGFVFENTYIAAPVDVTVEGTKTVTALGGNTYTMTGGEFTFSVVPAENNPNSDPVREGYTVSNDSNGKIVFINAVQGGLGQYTESGEYIYSVSEVDGSNKGIQEDSAVYTITISIKDDGNGHLVPTTSFAKNNTSAESVVFDNKYEPNVEAVLLHGLKVLSSEHKDKLEAGLFKFNVEAVSGTELVGGVETAVSTENIPMPATTSATHDATGVFQFESIEYKKPGTYVYRITEDTTSNVLGYEYSDAAYEVTVKVTDVAGELSAEVSGLVDINNKPLVVFTNGYVPEEVTLQGETALKGTKTLNGRDMVAGEFEFKLTAADGTPMPAAATVKNAADGSFSFEPITFSKAGTYYYTIAETNNGLGGVTYDETVYTATVEVTDEGGYLAAVVTYTAKKADSQEQEEKTSVVFANTYEATPISYALSAEKTLSGRDLDDKEFLFELKSGDEVLQKKENTASGVVAFDAIEYDKVGDYVYTITEVVGDKGGVTYDTNTFTVTVKVTDNLKGALEAEVSSVVKQTADGSVAVESKEIVFENAYAPADTSITLKGTKTLTGRKLAEGEFTFLLKNAEGEVISQATNAADGTITFEALPFTQVGTFEYTVVEDSSEQAEGIVYDDSEYAIVIKVTDNLKGQLVAEVISQEEIIFDNQYTEPKVVATKLQSINNGEATVEAKQVKAGDMITYVIKLVNDGNAMAKNIEITDVIPEGLDLMTGTIKGGDAAKVSEDGTITWTIFRLEAGKSTEVSFQVAVPTVKEDTTWTNVATFVYDNNPDNPTDPEEPKTPEETNEVEVTEAVPRLEVVKKQKINLGFATDNTKSVKEGDKVVYYITVTNNGNGDAEDIVITDKVPEGLALIDGSISYDGIYSDGVITWNLDTIKAGDKVTVEFAVKVPAVEEDTTWKNVAAVVYGNNPDNPTDPEAPGTLIPSNEVTIEEKAVLAPITGDATAITMWFALAFTSMMTVIGTVVSRRRRAN